MILNLYTGGILMQNIDVCSGTIVATDTGWKVRIGLVGGGTIETKPMARAEAEELRDRIDFLLGPPPANKT